MTPLLLVGLRGCPCACRRQLVINGPHVTEARVSGLPIGVRLVFHVCYTSAAGLSDWSEPSEPPVMLGALITQLPSPVSTQQSLDAVVLTWNPPQLTPHEAPIHHFEVKGGRGAQEEERACEDELDLPSESDWNV